MQGWVGFLLAVLILGGGRAVRRRVRAPARQGRPRHGRPGDDPAGLGEVVDPPKRNLIEAIEGEEQEGATTGEPRDATGGS
jgi:hypothetical protein